MTAIVTEQSRLRSWVRSVICNLMNTHVHLNDTHGEVSVALRASKDPANVTLEIGMRRKRDAFGSYWPRLCTDADVDRCNAALIKHLPVLDAGGKFDLDTLARTEHSHREMKQCGMPQRLIVGRKLVFKADLTRVDPAQCEGLEDAGRHSKKGVLLPRQERRNRMAERLAKLADSSLRLNTITPAERAELLQVVTWLKAIQTPVVF